MYLHDADFINKKGLSLYELISIMSTSRTFPLLTKRLRLLKVPRWAGTRRGLHYQEKPGTDIWRFNSIPLLASIAFSSVASASFGWWAHGHLGSGNTSKSQPSPEPEIEVRVIPIPNLRLPSSEKPRVMKDREAAQRFLIQRYPLDGYKIFLDMSLPGDHYDNPDAPSTDQHNDVDAILTSPAVIYRVEKATDKGKTVAFLIYAHPDAKDHLLPLQLRLQMLLQSMDHKGAFAYVGDRI